MLGHILWEMFFWPGGIVVGNLIASAIWATPAVFHLRRKMNKHHDAMKEHVTNLLNGNNGGINK